MAKRNSEAKLSQSCLFCTITEVQHPMQSGRIEQKTKGGQVKRSTSEVWSLVFV